MSSLSHTDIIIIVIVSACAALGMAYAMARFCTSREFDLSNEFDEPSPSQQEYMREVRQRSQDELWEYAMAGRQNERAKKFGVPKV